MTLVQLGINRYLPKLAEYFIGATFKLFHVPVLLHGPCSPFHFPSHCPPSPVTGPPVVSLATTQHRSHCPAGSLCHRGKLRTQGIQATSSHGHCHASGRGLLFLADLASTAPALQSHDLFQQGKHLTWGKNKCQSTIVLHGTKFVVTRFPAKSPLSPVQRRSTGSEGCPARALSAAKGTGTSSDQESKVKTKPPNTI